MKEKDLIKKQQIYFENLIKKIENSNNVEKKLDIATVAAYYATYHHTGYYYSTKLEKFFVDYAKSIDIDFDNNYTPNTYLHVITTAYITGGHTRVVEKWIEQSPIKQVHSVVCINQENTKIPERLKQNILSKNGELILLNENNITEKALKLRQIASKFEYIILHIHMEDPTAIIAFGTNKFRRPIIFYNHADHMFWLGKSIIDKLASLREVSDFVTVPKRNIKDSFMLGVPIESKILTILDKQDAKKILNLDTNKKLIISIGNSHKYQIIGGKSIVDSLLSIIKKRNDIQVIIIGPNPKEKLWKDAYKKSEGIIKTIGQVNYSNRYFDYINAADLIIDSWPMSGGTVMIDAISCNTPILSLKNPLGQFDYLTQSCAYCQSEEEICQKANLILNDDKYRNNLINQVKRNLEKDHSVNNWTKKLELLINATPKFHTLKDLSEELENKDIDDAAICLNYVYNHSFMKKHYTKQIYYFIMFYIFRYILMNKKKSFHYLLSLYKYI